jgi:hypothetical protein
MGVVVHNCDPSTWEAEAGGSQVPGHSGPYNKTYLKKKNKLKT